MAETSRSQVTITLGRSGQVVKRPGSSLDGGFTDSQPAIGSKRSVRDRLGSNVDAIRHDKKRQRGDSNGLGSKAASGVDDIHLGKHDLRFKIMKRTQSGGQQNGMDLREMLSRPARPSTISLGVQQHISEPRSGRQRMPEPKDARQHMPEPRDVRRMPELRDVRQRMPEPRDVRQRMLEPIEVRQHIPELNGVRQRIPEPSNASILGRTPSTRSADTLPRMSVLRNSYSPWTLDHIRRRSPDGVFNTSRGLSPPRNVEEPQRRVFNTSRGLSPPRNAEEPQRRATIRMYDDRRTDTYMRRDVYELSRPMANASFMTKPALPAKPVAPLADEQLTVEGFLHSLGLEKYAISFKVEEVDMAALRQMGDNDLKDLGIPMGPRKKILLALLSRFKRQAR